MINFNVSLESKWGLIASHLKEAVTPQQYRTWFKSMRLHSCSDNTYVFIVANNFLREWISRYYEDVLKKCIQRAEGDTADTTIIIETAPPGAAEPSEKTSIKDSVSDRPPIQSPPTQKIASRPAVKKVNDFYLNPNYIFENFVVGPSNHLSYAASLAVSENPSQSYNPLFLHGSSGLGKTHLLQAICHKLLTQNPAIEILYLSCETFINHFISSVEKGNLDRFRFKYRHIDILLIDDIHLLANKERTQEEFFHTFNSLYNSGKQIVLSSDSPPSEIPTLGERLVSRFKWGLVSELSTPDFETRFAILKMKSRLKDVDVPDDVLTFLAENIDTNIRELEGAITKVTGYASLMNLELNLPMAYEAMKDVIKKKDRFVSFDHVIKIITEKFSVKLSDLQSKKRNQSITLPRQIAMFILKNHTSFSLQDIGACFGGRDHTTVLHAYNKIKEKMKSDENFKELIDALVLKITKS